LIRPSFFTASAQLGEMLSLHADPDAPQLGVFDVDKKTCLASPSTCLDFAVGPTPISEATLQLTQDPVRASYGAPLQLPAYLATYGFYTNLPGAPLLPLPFLSVPGFSVPGFSARVASEHRGHGAAVPIRTYICRAIRRQNYSKRT
jgi:hypothetical protein